MSLLIWCKLPGLLREQDPLGPDQDWKASRAGKGLGSPLGVSRMVSVSRETRPGLRPGPSPQEREGAWEPDSLRFLMKKNICTSY